MEYRYIAIDPGKTGHIVVLNEDGQVTDEYPTPLIGREYDKQLMKDKLNKYNEGYKVHVVLEDVHTTQMGGKSSNFDFGRGKGLWEMALMALSIPHTMVTPKVWQKEMWQGAKTQYKVTTRKTKQGSVVKKIDTKLTSLIAAKMLFPNEQWFNVSIKTNKPLSSINDGKVDAILMAEYCRRNFR
jgi:hypothetical protein